MIKKYMALINMIRFKSAKDNKYTPSSRNDVLYRDKDLEVKKEREANQLINVQRLPRADDDISNDSAVYSGKKEIVGIVKPIGRWTSLILGQKVTYLMQHAEVLKSRNDQGYWVNMMNAREISKGKGRGM
jgi:hypothetical protein